MQGVTSTDIPGLKRDLEPLMEMLVDRGNALARPEWVALVNATKERVIQAPEQYLSGLARPSLALTQAIEDVFAERLN